jgi:hypothetical protein
VSTAAPVVPAEPTDATSRVLEAIRHLSLERSVLELESQGYTVLRGGLTGVQVENAKDAILKRAERTAGARIDMENETGNLWRGQKYLPYLLYEDPVFEEILLNPKPLALITWLLGESCLLSSIGCHFKGPGGDPLPLHSDNGNGMPAPYSHISMVANVNYALTPYSKQAGALAMVPGSHRWCRAPSVRESRLGQDDHNPAAIAMDLEPGDCVIWHGNTWHGSFARQIPGIRMNLAVYFNRQHIQTQERHKGVVPAGFLERHRNHPRMNILLGGKQPYGWQTEGPDYSLMAQNPRGVHD